MNVEMKDIFDVKNIKYENYVHHLNVIKFRNKKKRKYDYNIEREYINYTSNTDIACLHNMFQTTTGEITIYEKYFDLFLLSNINLIRDVYNCIKNNIIINIYVDGDKINFINDQYAKYIKDNNIECVLTILQNYKFCKFHYNYNVFEYKYECENISLNKKIKNLFLSKDKKYEKLDIPKSKFYFYINTKNSEYYIKTYDWKSRNIDNSYIILQIYEIFMPVDLVCEYILKIIRQKDKIKE